MVGQNGLHVKRTYECTRAHVDARVSTQVDARVNQYCASGCERGRIHVHFHLFVFKVDYWAKADLIYEHAHKIRSTVAKKSTLKTNR